MKKIFLYTAIAATATILTATDSWARAHSNECVKSGSGSKYYVRCYDSNGNITSEKRYSGDPDNGASVSRTDTYTYDAKGNQTSYKQYSGDPDNGGSVTMTYIYTYDSNGNNTSYKRYSGDPYNGASVYSVGFYAYDSNGNKTSSKEYFGDPDNGGSVTSTYTWTYDSNGNKTSEKRYYGDPDNGVSVTSAYTYTYDSNGNLISYKKHTFNSNGSGKIKKYTCNGSSTACLNETLISSETFTAEQRASILAGFPTNYFPPANSAPKPKRTYYTLEEAMGHLSHDNNNKIIFTFK